MPVDTSAGRLSITYSGKLAVGMPSCLELRPKPRTTWPRQKYCRCLMTPSARGAGCGPVCASGGAAIEAVPGPAGGHGRELRRPAGGGSAQGYNGTSVADDTPRRDPHDADRTEDAGLLRGCVWAPERRRPRKSLPILLVLK